MLQFTSLEYQNHLRYSIERTPQPISWESQRRTRSLLMTQSTPQISITRFFGTRPTPSQSILCEFKRRISSLSRSRSQPISLEFRKCHCNTKLLIPQMKSHIICTLQALIFLIYVYYSTPWTCKL